MSIEWYDENMERLNIQKCVQEIHNAKSGLLAESSEDSSDDDHDNSYHTSNESDNSNTTGSITSSEESQDHDQSMDETEEIPLKKSTSNTRENRKRKFGGKCRESRHCPISSCEAKVIHIPRHLHKVHGWSKRMQGQQLYVTA
ncbi:PREDICTED: uncharacterized protein LOC107332449 isoform X2 [Acropora digitifera]|uniref:uncharacterized protein LOC107332449 isoform X2 n=1 Tax=Acropora digitifera TaxID=70779 RepID=UPI00077A8DA2|nr:PREDICTED: uncharacterized protein LOC107332449 isoform X2 [Acropora digitifera]XP_015752670.1 PREDICTED: uncharacterized protein LOC107332449 isoform X2 [Acropora digitifera]